MSLGIALLLITIIIGVMGLVLRCLYLQRVCQYQQMTITAYQNRIAELLRDLSKDL